MLYSFSLNLCISLSLTFTALTLNLKIKRVSFDLGSNETSNMTQKRLQIHHDYHYYIKHYAPGAREKSAVAACCIIQLHSRKRTELFLILRFAEARGKQSRFTHRVQWTIHLQLVLLSMRCRYLFFPASNRFRSSSVCSSRGGMSLTCPSASNETYVKNALHVLTLLSKRKTKS